MTEKMHWAHVMIDVPPRHAEASGAFWTAALGWPLDQPWGAHPEFRSFAPDGGDAYVHQQVADQSPRVHLDLEVSDPDAEADRLATLGATAGLAFPHWRPMASPGGLPFCLVQAQARTRPAPLRWGAGHRTRAAQVCVDAPADRHDAEVAFWRAATGWQWTPGQGAAEFEGKLDGPAGSPLRLLLQRLGPDDAGTDVRAHLDLGTDDIEADAARLVDLGAERLHPGDGWITLRDPAGMVFCTTGNDPD
jgi:hypothetical protein